jgi:hypothetical protein
VQITSSICTPLGATRRMKRRQSRLKLQKLKLVFRSFGGISADVPPSRQTVKCYANNKGNSVIRLLYISNASATVTDEQVQDILVWARKNNPPNGITGVLIHGGGLFMQVLEGPEENVLRQYVKILDDQRHSDIQILHISPAYSRIFEQWSMGDIAGNPLQFEHVSEFRTRRLEVVQAKTFKKTMRDFVQRLNAEK